MLFLVKAALCFIFVLCRQCHCSSSGVLCPGLSTARLHMPPWQDAQTPAFGHKLLCFWPVVLHCILLKNSSDMEPTMGHFPAMAVTEICHSRSVRRISCLLVLLCETAAKVWQRSALLLSLFLCLSLDRYFLQADTQTPSFPKNH